jgi:PleD family two-component response regulator
MQDEPDKISDFLKLFKQKGILCDLAINSSEAIKLLETKEYDVIISNMANVDASGYHLIAGLLFLQKVKDDLDMDIPFILYCSKDEMLENKDIAMELGARAIVFSSEKLIRLLELG